MLVRFAGSGTNREKNATFFFKDTLGKEFTCNAGDMGSIPGSGRSLGGGNGNPLQYSGLGNPMDGGARQAPVCGVSKSQESDMT